MTSIIPAPTPIRDMWSRVRSRLKAECGEAEYNSWLIKLDIVGLNDGCAVMATPTRFLRNWVAPRYGDKIRALWRVEDSSVRNVEFVVQAVNGPGTAPQVMDPAAATAPAPDQPAAPSTSPASTPAARAGFELDERFTFDNFVVGKPNAFAHAAALQVADSEKVQFNPLFVYGGVGLGKTHLMHAIAWHLRRNRPDKRVVYLSAEKFMYEFVHALRHGNIMAFKERYRSLDVLMIDDVQFIGGKESTQEEFFHTFNALVDQNRQIVLSGDRSPNEMDSMEERMRSRLGCGLVAEVHATSYELRLGILQAKAQQFGHGDLPHDVLEFLAHKITANVRELEGALNRVIAHSRLIGAPINIDTAQEILHDLLRAHQRVITIEEIQKKVADYYGIKMSEMSSARRARIVARPRQVAMYLAKMLTQRSLPEIGRKFGKRDHTTVMHAIKRVEQLSKDDAAFAEDVNLLRRSLDT